MPQTGSNILAEKRPESQPAGGTIDTSAFSYNVATSSSHFRSVKLGLSRNTMKTNSTNPMTILSFLIFFVGLVALGVFAVRFHLGLLFEVDPSPHLSEIAYSLLQLALILSSVPFSIAAHLLGQKRT